MVNRKGRKGRRKGREAAYSIKAFSYIQLRNQSLVNAK